MYRQEHDDQLSFKDFFLPFGNQLSDNKHCNKLAELIPWYELKDDYVAQFCKNFEAPAKSFRMALCPASTPLAVSRQPDWPVATASLCPNLGRCAHRRQVVASRQSLLALPPGLPKSVIRSRSPDWPRLRGPAFP